MTIKDQIQTTLKDARVIIEKAQREQRRLTDDERKTVDQRMAEARKLKDQQAEQERSQKTIAELAALGRELTGGGGLDAWGVEGRGFLRLKSGAAATAGRLAQQVRPDEVGRKALVGAGTVTTGVVISPEVLAEGKPATSIFDVLPTALRNAPLYRHLRQITRDNNAAVVAPGATKPTSVYTIESVDAQLEVVAHMSEPVDVYMAQDTPGLQSFIASELGYGLATAVEAKALADVAATTGIQTPAAGADVFATTRHAVTLLENVGLAGGFYAFSPSDWEAIELAQDSVGRYYMSATAPLDIAARRLWGVPAVVSVSVTPGTGWLVGDGAVELSSDGQVSLRWSESQDDFERNQVRARCEGRFQTDVLRPIGVVKLTL
jgi:HK97 family phage major capsid protein